MKALTVILVIVTSVVVTVGITLTIQAAPGNAGQHVARIFSPRHHFVISCAGGIVLEAVTKQAPERTRDAWRLAFQGKEAEFPLYPNCAKLLEPFTPSATEGVLWNPEREFPQPAPKVKR